MALAVLMLLLWDPTLFVHGDTSPCNVTCSTDYSESLNCSCSGSVPTPSVLVSVVCRDEELAVNGSCDVRPPQSWCVMYPENLFQVTSVGVMCTATVGQQGDEGLINASESALFALSNVVKPLPPFKVQVTNTNGLYNITWNHKSDIQEDCFTYRVRIRESRDTSKDPAHSLLVQEMYIVLDPERLQPQVNYTVDVRAKICPGNVYEGPWSEWSSSAEWTTTGNSETEGMNGYWPYMSFFIMPVLGLLWLGYSQKSHLKRKIQLITYIPKPDRFFKPLYHMYGGNFKEWVKPVFSEYDYLKIHSQVPMLSERPHDVLQLDNEKRSFREDSEKKQGGPVVHMLQPHSSSLLFFQDGGSSQGTGHSIGHISIHTVTLSGEEEFEEEAASQSSVETLRSHQDGDSFGPFEEDNRERAGNNLEVVQLSRLARQHGILPQYVNQISEDVSVGNVSFQQHAQLNEPERVSLDSFASNEQSEDGYPRVDLDTIDSGFGECSSPGACDSNTTEQKNSDLFHEHKSSNSNYVRQWMICSTVQENPSHLENELQET